MNTCGQDLAFHCGHSTRWQEAVLRHRNPWQSVCRTLPKTFSGYLVHSECSQNYFLKHCRFFNFALYLCMCVCVHARMCVYLCVCVHEYADHPASTVQSSENNLYKLVFFYLWLLGIELRSKGLAASTFTSWAIWLSLNVEDAYTLSLHEHETTHCPNIKFSIPHPSTTIIHSCFWPASSHHEVLFSTACYFLLF